MGINTSFFAFCVFDPTNRGKEYKVGVLILFYDIFFHFLTTRLYMRKNLIHVEEFHFSAQQKGQGHVTPQSFLHLFKLEESTFQTSQKRKLLGFRFCHVYDVRYSFL